MADSNLVGSARGARLIGVLTARTLILFFAIVVAALQCRRLDRSQPAPSVKSNGSHPPALASSDEPSQLGGASTSTLPEVAPKETANFIIPFGNSTVRFFPSLVTHAEKKRPAFLLALHGLGGDGDQIVQALHLAAMAKERHVLYAAPDGEIDQQGRRFWDAGLCCNFSGTRRDDVSRLDAVIGHAIGELGADPQRVFVVGFSNGGIMAHRLACASAHEVHAVVSMAAFGPSQPDECRSSRAVAVLEIHGDQDRVVPFAGGRLFGNPAMPHTPSVLAGLKGWAHRNACAGKMVLNERLDLDPDLPGAETEVLGYRSCARAPVTLWKVRGAGHSLGLRLHFWDFVWKFLERS